jgi:trehalose 6-phosphate phosphatase
VPGIENIHTGALITADTHIRLPAPPKTLLNGASLFLDLDGTLLELIDDPDAVVADQLLRDLLLALVARLDGRLAVISGRSLAQLEAILGPVCDAVALSGSHGCEHRWRGVAAQPSRPASLDAAAERFRTFADAHPGAIVEDKSYGVALHYRLAPMVEQGAHALAEQLACALDLQLQPGKMMVELRVPGGDKGVAVRRLMGRPPMAGTTPIFLGDDVTDEAGFEAAHALGGAGILVGTPRETAAGYALPDPASVRAWLAEAIA